MDTKKLNKQVINTENAPAPIGPYSQAVKGCGLVFVSGQIPLDPKTAQLVTGSIVQETKRVMENINGILTEAGLSFDHIVKTTIFLKDMNQFSEVNETYGSFFKGSFPARETVEVSRLPKDVNVEISVIATVE